MAETYLIKHLSKIKVSASIEVYGGNATLANFQTDLDWKWELTENKTTFFDWGYEIDPEKKARNYDQWKIRIAHDTMEWILKVDEEYLYQVLVKE